MNRASERDARLCQDLLQGVIDAEQRSGTQLDGSDDEPSEANLDADGVDEFPGETDARTVSYIQAPVADEYYDVDGAGKYALSSSEEVPEGELVADASGDESIAGEYEGYAGRGDPEQFQPQASCGHAGDSGDCAVETYPQESASDEDDGEGQETGGESWPAPTGTLTSTIPSRAGQSYVLPGGSQSLARIERSPQYQSHLDKNGAPMEPAGAESSIPSRVLHGSSELSRALPQT